GLGLALPVIVVAMFLLAPGYEDGRLIAVLRGICAQRPAHSIGGQAAPMALEARMYGIFAGFALTVAFVWLRGGWHRTRLPRGLQLAVVLAFVTAMTLDGLNALFFDLG